MVNSFSTSLLKNLNKGRTPKTEPAKVLVERSIKGEFEGTCNRSACQKPIGRKNGGNWFNKGNQKYYCASCAHTLNDVNGYPLHDQEKSLVIKVEAPVTEYVSPPAKY